MTKIFLTGATGMLGGELALSLANEGFDVHCLTRAPTLEAAQARLDERIAKSNLFVGQKLTAVLGDLHKENLGINKEDLDYAIIVHAAAETVFNNEESCQKTNVEGTDRIVKFAQKVNPKLLCFISTACNVGHVADISLYEDDGCLPENEHHNSYTKSKALAEKLVQNSGLPFLIVRPSIVLSDTVNDRTFARQIFWFAPLVFKFDAIPVCPEARCDIVPVSYVVEYTTKLIKQDQRKYDCYHITAGEKGYLTATQWLESIRQHGGYPSIPKLIPPTDWCAETHKEFVTPETESWFRGLQYYFPFMNMNVIFSTKRLVEEFEDLKVPELDSYLGFISDQVTEAEAIKESHLP